MLSPVAASSVELYNERIDRAAAVELTGVFAALFVAIFLVMYGIFRLLIEDDFDNFERVLVFITMIVHGLLALYAIFLATENSFYAQILRWLALFVGIGTLLATILLGNHIETVPSIWDIVVIVLMIVLIIMSVRYVLHAGSFARLYDAILFGMQPVIGVVPSAPPLEEDIGGGSVADSNTMGSAARNVTVDGTSGRYYSYDKRAPSVLRHRTPAGALGHMGVSIELGSGSGSTDRQ